MKPTANALTRLVEAPRRTATVAALRSRLAAEGADQHPVSRADDPIWEHMSRTRRSTPTSDEVLHRTRAITGEIRAELEEAILATLARPMRPDESHKTTHDARERELYPLLAQLTPIENYHLRRRLDLDRNGDALAAAFRRLVQERRTRIRAFLADPSRRIAVRTL